MKKCLIIIILLSSLFVSKAQLPSFIKDSLDNYILQGIKDW